VSRVSKLYTVYTHHVNDANARYCELCALSTVFFGLLLDWKTERPRRGLPTIDHLGINDEDH
jgi:hypothetical protein